MDDLKERLRWCSDPAEFDADIMSQWDRWRKMIADGHKGSLPRDQFEALICGFIETHADALARIEEQERERDTARCAANLFAAYLCGRNKCHIRVALAGNPDVCDSLINKAADWMDSNPIDDEKSIESIA